MTDIERGVDDGMRHAGLGPPRGKCRQCHRTWRQLVLLAMVPMCGGSTNTHEDCEHEWPEENP